MKCGDGQILRRETQSPGHRWRQWIACTSAKCRAQDSQSGVSGTSVSYALSTNGVAYGQWIPLSLIGGTATTPVLTIGEFENPNLCFMVHKQAVQLSVSSLATVSATAQSCHSLWICARSSGFLSLQHFAAHTP